MIDSLKQLACGVVCSNFPNAKASWRQPALLILGGGA